MEQPHMGRADTVSEEGERRGRGGVEEREREREGARVEK